MYVSRERRHDRRRGHGSVMGSHADSDSVFISPWMVPAGKHWIIHPFRSASGAGHLSMALVFEHGSSVQCDWRPVLVWRFDDCARPQGVVSWWRKRGVPDGSSIDPVIQVATTIPPKGKYNSVDSCCLFVTNRQLNRQLVQWAVCLAVYRVINSSFDTQTHGDLVYNWSL